MKKFIFAILIILVCGVLVSTIPTEENKDDISGRLLNDSEYSLAHELKKDTAINEMRLIQKEKERKAKEKAERLAEEKHKEEASKQVAVQQQHEYSAPSGNGILTKSGGVNYYNGRKETYYSQRVLPGGGLNIPGRHVAEDGTVRDGDGYICVASSDHPRGTVIETSLGTGKVYDSGCASGTIDLYTDW